MVGPRWITPTLSTRSTRCRAEVLWLIDTSAWARRDVTAVKEQLGELLSEDDELALSPPVLLELLRGPQGEEVARERALLTGMMITLPADEETFRLATWAMEHLAAHAPEGHRLPVTDLVTAALAHRHRCGVVHCDGDYEQIAEHGGLSFPHRKIEIPDTPTGAHPDAGGQRALKKELGQLLHRMPASQAEVFLERVVGEARAALQLPQ